MVAGLEMSCFLAHLAALQDQAYLDKDMSGLAGNNVAASFYVSGSFESC